MSFDKLPPFVSNFSNQIIFPIHKRIFTSLAAFHYNLSYLPCNSLLQSVISPLLYTLLVLNPPCCKLPLHLITVISYMYLIKSFSLSLSYNTPPPFAALYLVIPPCLPITTTSYLVKSSSLLSSSWECCECSDWVKDGRGMRGLWSPPGWGRSSERGEGLETGIVMEEVDFGTLELDCVLG